MRTKKIRSRAGKKAFMPEFFVRFLIALIFIGSALYIGSKLFRLSDKGYDEYDKLAGLINDVKENGEIRSISLSMDKDTAIAGFSGDDEQSVSRYNLPSPAGQIIFVFQRGDFPACMKDKSKSCICLVQKPEFETYSNVDEHEQTDTSPVGAGPIGRSSTTTYSNRQLNYKPESGSKVYCKDVDPELRFQCDLDKKPDDGFACSQGFILERGMADGEIESYNTYFSSERARGIYIENYKGIIVVCLKSPCVADKGILKAELEQDIKEENQEKAVKIFLAFLENFDKCTNNIGYEETFSLNFPSPDYRINQGDDGSFALQEKTEKGYVDVEGAKAAANIILNCDGTSHEYARNANLEISKDDKGNCCTQEG